VQVLPVVLPIFNRPRFYKPEAVVAAHLVKQVHVVAVAVQVDTLVQAVAEVK
jgi:hypothetical protein